MKITQFALAAVVMFGLSGMTGAAFAQSKVFTVDEQQVRQQSKLGKELNAVLETVANQGVEQLGLKALRTEVDTEGAALKPQIESLTPEAINANPTLKARVDALNRKASELIQKQNALNQTLEQREGGYRLAFLQVLAPAVEAVAKEAGADLVVDVTSTWFIKEAIDLTPRVVARLDATVPNVAALQAALPKPPAAPGAAPAPAGAGQ